MQTSSIRQAKLGLAGLLGLLMVLIPMFSHAQSAREIVDKSVAAMGRYKTLSGTLKRTERINGKMVNGELRFKVQESPRKVYIYNVTPDDGAEVLYLEGQNDNEALVNPNKPLMPNLNLNPYGDLLIKDQHHSLHSLGLRFTRDIVKFSMDKYGEDFDKYVTLKGSNTWHGKAVYAIEINFSDWTWEDYKVTKTETLLDLERRLKVNASMVAEKNGYSINQRIKAGTTIKIPNAYGKKTILFIDKATWLPIYQEVHDEKGIVEKYTYLNLKVNPSFSANTFSEDNSDYGF